MSAVPPVLASAVILPETEEPEADTPVPAKRRRSSISVEDSKRPRLAALQASTTGPAAATGGRVPSGGLRSGANTEERIRGKRLFGALLGALNQSSSSAAQRRRGDIEQKQQEKLKLQTAEYNEQQKKDLDALLEARRAEQDVYLRQAARTQRSNVLAKARFLQTLTEPRLYFQPLKLLPDQEMRIEAEIDVARNDADKLEGKSAGADTTYPEPQKDAMSLAESPATGPLARASEQSSETLENEDIVMEGSRSPSGGRLQHENIESNKPEDNAPQDVSRANDEPEKSGGSSAPRRRLSDASRDAAEDAGDNFVKGDEDDVIY